MSAPKDIRRALMIAKEPTDAQKSAGNYKKHHMSWRGLSLAIENAKGSKRSGVDPHGKAWSTTLPAHYGYIKRTEGNDGDHVDAYMGPKGDSDHVTVVDQHDPKSGKFDEHKVILGFGGRAEALRCYDAAFSDGSGPRRRKGVTDTNVDGLKEWLKEGDTKKPFGRVAKAAGGEVKLKTDVPDESWLQRKIDSVKAEGKDRWGVPAMRTITGSYTGNVNVPVDVLASLPGQRGEQNNVRHDDLAAIKNIMQKTGKLPTGRDGKEYAPYIEVAHDGSAWVSEGNHRIMAAKALGWKTLPAEIRYFTGGERVDGPLHPSKLIPGLPGQKTSAVAKAAGGEVLPTDHPDRAANLAKHMEGSKTPPVLYHGTNVHDEPMGENTRPLGDIDTFDRHAAYKAFNRPEGMDAIGSWFSETPGDHKEDKPGAGQYGDLIYPAHVRITNPWRPKNFDHFLDEMHRAAGRDPKKQRPRGRGSVSELRDKLIRAGHDGIYFDQPLDHKNQSPTWVAFHPHQIKSAIGNNGQFDPNNPNITKAEGGGVKTIKLRGSGDPGKLKNFMDEFHKDTHPHPFGNRERFLNTDTGLPPGEDFATVEASPFDEKIHVSSVSALSKRRGQGTQALQYLKDLSDKHNVPLSLDPVAYGQGGMNDKQLEKWYGGHGFSYDDRSDLMVRPPATASGRVGKAVGGPMFGADFETISRYLGRPVGAGLQTFKPPVAPPTPGVAPTPGVITPSSYGVPPGGFPSVTGVGDRDTPGGVVPGPNNGDDRAGRAPNGAVMGIPNAAMALANMVVPGLGVANTIGNAVNTSKNAKELDAMGAPLSFGQKAGGVFGLNNYNGELAAAMNAQMNNQINRGTGSVLSGKGMEFNSDGDLANGNGSGNNGSYNFDVMTGNAAAPAAPAGGTAPQGEVAVTDITNNDGGGGEVSSDGGGMTGGGWGYGGPEGYRGGGMAYAAGGAAVQESAAAPAADPMNEPGFSTYHGSPHKFDEFDSGKIGTGTGNRNFGEGFYVADHEPEARGFGDAAFKKSSEAFAARALADNGTREKAMKKLRTKFEGQTDSYAALARSAHDILASGDDVSRRSHMYEIKVKAHPDHFMDWDEKIADQHPKVREILSRLPDEALYKNSKLKIDALPGHGVYRRLTDSLGSTKAASDMLAKVGLPGAKYHDGISHADKKKKTYNYVVFDPKNMEVMRRYAQGGEVYSGKHPKHYAAGGSVADDPSTQRALALTAGAAMSPSAYLEVAPGKTYNPKLHEVWEGLHPQAKEAISNKVIGEHISDWQRKSGIAGEVRAGLGGFGGYTNPNYTFQPYDKAHLPRALNELGHLFSQDAMMGAHSHPFEGSKPAGVVRIALPKGLKPSEIHEIYQNLNKNGLADGHSSDPDGGFMDILSGESGEDARKASLLIDKALGGKYHVSAYPTNIAFPEHGENYDRKLSPRSKRSDASASAPDYLAGLHQKVAGRTKDLVEKALQQGGGHQGEVSFGDTLAPGQPHPDTVSAAVPTTKAAYKGPPAPGTPRTDISPQLHSEDNRNAIATRMWQQHPASGGVELSGPDATKALIDFHTKNALAIWDRTPIEQRKTSRHWYRSAHALGNAYAEEHGIQPRAAHAMMAVLSPQNPWDKNVTQAERVMNILHGRLDQKWTDAMSDVAYRGGPGGKGLPNDKGTQETGPHAWSDIEGKTLRDVLNGPHGEKKAAMWIRAFDEAHNPTEYKSVSPTGEFLGTMMNKTGSKPDTSSWNSYSPIQKAISIWHDPSIGNINDKIGDNHKVREFYNVITNPHDPNGVVVDTHAVAAGQLLPHGSSAKEVHQNFGSSPGLVDQARMAERGTPWVPSKKTGSTGAIGDYPFHAEAVRRAAWARGVHPSEMQSVTWETVRRLFSNKSQAAQRRARDIWSDYANGRLTHGAAVDKIFSSNPSPPSWGGQAGQGTGDVKTGSYVKPGEIQVNSPAVKRYATGGSVDDALRLTAKYQPTLPGRQQIKRGRP